MPARRSSLILAMLALPTLWGCGRGGSEAPEPPSAAALAAISDPGGAPRDALGHAIDALFEDGAVGHTRALVVMKRGSVIVERYGAGIKPATRLPGWSAGQCLTALMVGQLVSDGRLRLDQSVPVPEWQRAGDPRGEITLRQLLQMRSGLRHAEVSQPDSRGLEGQSDRMRLLFLDGRDDMAAYAEAQPLEAPAGARFEPSSASAVILADLAARVLSPDGDPARRRRAVSDYLRNRVLLPIGMTSTIAGFDRAGTMIGAGMIHADARDWARLVEFLRHTGAVRGAQVLPRRWIQLMLRPSPREPSYGAGVWLNRPGGDKPGQERGVTLWPGVLPANAFACVGEYGQYMVGSPDQLISVVRLGTSDAAQEPVLKERLGRLLALFPGA